MVTSTNKVDQKILNLFRFKKKLVQDPGVGPRQKDLVAGELPETSLQRASTFIAQKLPVKRVPISEQEDEEELEDKQEEMDSLSSSNLEESVVSSKAVQRQSHTQKDWFSKLGPISKVSSQAASAISTMRDPYELEQHQSMHNFNPSSTIIAQSYEETRLLSKRMTRSRKQGRDITGQSDHMDEKSSLRDILFGAGEVDDER